MRSLQGTRMSVLQVEKTRISNPIDFDKNGRQAGCLRAPLSRNGSPWGVVEIPMQNYDAIRAAA